MEMLDSSSVEFGGVGFGVLVFPKQVQSGRVWDFRADSLGVLGRPWFRGLGKVKLETLHVAPESRNGKFQLRN